MAKITKEIVERVRDAADIVQVVGEFVALKQAGARLKGLCPFHEEKTPSFTIDPDRKLFYCFGCQAGGDLFKFVTEYEGVSFPEAVENLANRFGVTLPDAAPKTRAEVDRERALSANELAAAFFKKMLAEGPGTGARAYLERRGLSHETIDRLGLGYAPDRWDALLEHLASKNVTGPDAERAGLVKPSRNKPGQRYDRFRNRLIFPIHDVTGRTVAFGGRALGEGAPDTTDSKGPKYLNSPESPAYVKSEHLYGLDLARDAIRREGFVVLVEGYMDLAALLQADVTNVVASLGTALTPAQARLLSRYTQRVVVSYDGDAAGSAAAVKSFDLLLAAGLDVRVVDLPAGQDPDDCIRDHGADDYRRRVRSAAGYLEYLVEREVHSRDLGRPEEKVAALNAVLPHVVKLSTAVERSVWSDLLSEKLGIEDRVVVQELRNALRSGRETVRAQALEDSRIVQAEAHLVLLLIGGDETRRDAVFERLHPEDIEDSSPVYRIVHTIERMWQEGTTIDYDTVYQRLEDEADRTRFSGLAFRDESMNEETALSDCLAALERRRIEREVRRKPKEAVREAAGETFEITDDELARRVAMARELDAQHRKGPASGPAA